MQKEVYITPPCAKLPDSTRGFDGFDPMQMLNKKTSLFLVNAWIYAAGQYFDILFME